MVDTTQSPLAMLVLVTPYTILYIVNQLFLHGVLDQIHYIFFELIFVLAFRKIFGLPDLTERFFPTHRYPHFKGGPVNIQSVESVQPVKTNLAIAATTTTTTTITTEKTAATQSTLKGSTTMPSATTTLLGAVAAATKATSTTTVESSTFQDGVKIASSNNTVHHEAADLTITKLAALPQSASDLSTNLPAHHIAAKKKQNGPYAQELVAMEKKFMDHINNTDIWEKVYEDTSIKVPTTSKMVGGSTSRTSWIQVYQYKSRPMCYKIIAYMNSTPAVVFDTLCDLERRSDWDPMCVEARVLEEVLAPAGTTIQYVRTKAVWPTASRDTVVLGTVKDLGEGRGLFMVNASIEHASMPERVKEKIVRMETTVAGHVITPEQGGTTCKLVQVLDADLKGWIPDKVIQMVSTKAVPDGLRAVNKLIPKVEPYHESKVLAKAALAQSEVDAIWRGASPSGGDGMEQERSILEGESKDMDPVEEELAIEDPSTKLIKESGEQDTCIAAAEQEEEEEEQESKHTLRRQRSEDTDLTNLSDISDRLRAVEAEMAMSRRKDRQDRQDRVLRSRHLSRRTDSDSAAVLNDEMLAEQKDVEQNRRKRVDTSTAGVLEKTKPKSTFGVFWEGIKENLGFGLAGKANKILVAVIVVAVLGSSLAKLRRR